MESAAIIIVILDGVFHKIVKIQLMHRHEKLMTGHEFQMDIFNYCYK